MSEMAGPTADGYCCHHERLLIEAVTEASKRRGIIRDDIEMLSGPDCLMMLDEHHLGAPTPDLPPGVAVDGSGRWWLLPGHPMPAGAMYRYRADDEWRTPVFAPDSPEMTVCWSALQAHEIRLGS